MYRKATTLAIGLLCAVILTAFPGEAGADNGFLRGRRGVSINARDIFGNIRHNSRTPFLEENIIQKVDPADFDNWINETKISYIYSDGDILNGWTYSSALPGEGWAEPHKRATIERLANDLISTLTYSVYDVEQGDWLDEVRYSQQYNDNDQIEYLSVEHYDQSADEWIKEAYVEFVNYYYPGLQYIKIANRIDNDPGYEFEFVEFDYDHYDKRKLRAIFFADDEDNLQDTHYRRRIHYHESDTSTYDDFQNYVNNFSLYIDEDASWAMGGILSGFGYAKVESVYDYERITPDNWQIRYRYSCLYDESDNLTSFRSDEYQPPTAWYDHLWLGWQRYFVGYGQHGVVNELNSQKFEPINAINEIRYAYKAYQRKHGHSDGYSMEAAIIDAGLKQIVLKKWNFEVVGNPPTQFIATSTREHPLGEGHQVIYDRVRQRLSGFMVDIVPYWADPELMWLSDYRSLFTYRGVTSVEDNSVPSTCIVLSNYPNPFNPETTITFDLPQDVDNLELKIYNIRGQVIKTLISGVPRSRGESRIVWDGKDQQGIELGSGVYFYRLTTDEQSMMNKMLLVR